MSKLNIKEIDKKRKGFVLLVTFFIILLLMFIGGYFLSLMLTESRIAHTQAAGAQAYYLAEAGIHDLLWKLKNDSTWTNNFETDPTWQATISRSGELFPDGSYEVQIINSDLADGEITATSSLTAPTGNNVQRIVKTTAFKSTNPSPVGDAAIFSDKDLSFWGTITTIDGKIGGITDGSVHTNDDLELSFFSDVTIENRAAAVDQIDVSVTSSLTAFALESQNYPPAPAAIQMPQLDFDSADPNSYKNRANNIYTSNEFRNLLRDNPNLVIDGITYVTGEVKVKRGENLSVNGVLAADGNIKIGVSVFGSGTAKLTVNNTSGEPSGIFTKQKFQTGIWASHVNIDGLIYANDRMQLTNIDQQFDLTGSIITQRFSASSLWVNINFTHDDDIIREALGTPLFSPIINIDHWEEEY